LQQFFLVFKSNLHRISSLTSRTLRTCIGRFNNRRYYSQITNGLRFPDQNCNQQNQQNLNGDNDGGFNTAESEFNINIINSGTFADLNGISNDDCFELTNEFKKNYEMWLKEEVYCAEEFAIDWDEILKEASKVLINEIRNSIHYSTYFMKCN
jgi:hypothetical protein